MEQSLDPKVIVVHAPNEQGGVFIKMMQEKGLPLIALSTSPEQTHRLKKLGIDKTLFLDLKNEGIIEPPSIKISKAFLFVEDVIESIVTTYFLRRWTYAPIFVNITAPYKALGAYIVIYSHSRNLGFLISDL